MHHHKNKQTKKKNNVYATRLTRTFGNRNAFFWCQPKLYFIMKRLIKVHFNETTTTWWYGFITSTCMTNWIQVSVFANAEKLKITCVSVKISVIFPKTNHLDTKQDLFGFQFIICVKILPPDEHDYIVRSHTWFWWDTLMFTIFIIPLGGSRPIQRLQVWHTTAKLMWLFLLQRICIEFQIQNSLKMNLC